MFLIYATKKGISWSFRFARDDYEYIGAVGTIDGAKETFLRMNPAPAAGEIRDVSGELVKSYWPATREEALNTLPGWPKREPGWHNAQNDEE